MINKKSSIKNKQKEYDRMKTEILKIGLVKKGSINKRWYSCSASNCKCKKGKKFHHGPYYWLTWKEKNRTKTILLSEELLSEIESYKENYIKLKKIIKTMESISEQIIKEKVYELRKKKIIQKLKS